MSLRQRLAAVGKRLTGNVRLTPTGAPVIQTESGLQYEGYFVESLKCLDPGEHQLLSGPEIDFDSWEAWEESGLSWPAFGDFVAWSRSRSWP